MAQRGLRYLLDLPVVSAEDILLGDVQDVAISIPEQRLVKLSLRWAQEGQLSGPDASIPLSQIVAFEPHQLEVASEITETAGLDFEPYDEGELLQASDLLDHEVYTFSGTPLGTLTDIYFDESDGAVLGYEVDRPEATIAARVLGPATGMEFRDNRLYFPDRLQLIHLSAPSELEDETARVEDLVFEAQIAQRPTEEPDLEELDTNSEGEEDLL